MGLKVDVMDFFLYGIMSDRLRGFLNKNQTKENTMEINQETLNNPALREVVKEVIREEIKPEIEKMKTANQHLQEGNQYLNE